MRKKWLTVVVIASILGIIVASITTAQHIRLLKEGLVEDSYCSITEYVNCDVVNTSSYSEFLRIPIAWWGVLFYLSFFLFSLFVKFSKKDNRATIALCWFMSIGSIFYSIFLAYIAFFVLEVFCIECMAMYFVNIVLFVSLYLMLNIKLKDIISFVKNYIKAALRIKSNELGFSSKIFAHVLVLAVVFIPGYLIMYDVQAKALPGRFDMDVDDNIENHFVQSLHDIEPDLNRLSWGSPEAKVEIIEISDFGCPFCKLAAFNVKPRLYEFKDEVRYYFMHYPLSSQCNPYVKRDIHPQSCLAARATICAEEQGEFQSIHDWLFKNQDDITEKNLTQQAAVVKMNKDIFKECLYSQSTSDILKTDIEKANHIHIEGVPAIFVNKRPLGHWRHIDILHGVVKEEIKRSSKQN
ncbi:thioredoxin domain-containing protein [bacterium]|nr:thioredoxin domain-containing protein [bacterium]